MTRFTELLTAEEIVPVATYVLEGLVEDPDDSGTTVPRR